MKTLKKIVVVSLVLMVMLLLAGCSETVVPDGATGVVVHDGIVSDEYLQPGRHTTSDGMHTSIVIVDNKIKTASYANTIEGQSKDDVIINANVTIPDGDGGELQELKIQKKLKQY